MELWWAARKYMGVPFRHRGRTCNGLDCIGLVVRSVLDCYPDFPVKDLKAYSREPWKDGLRQYLVLNLGEPASREPQVNDIALMVLHRGQPPSHVGIIAPHPEGLGLIHTYGAIGKVAYHRLNEVWRAQITEVFTCAKP